MREQHLTKQLHGKKMLAPLQDKIEENQPQHLFTDLRNEAREGNISEAGRELPSPRPRTRLHSRSPFSGEQSISNAKIQYFTFTVFLWNKLQV